MTGNEELESWTIEYGLLQLLQYSLEKRFVASLLLSLQQRVVLIKGVPEEISEETINGSSALRVES